MFYVITAVVVVVVVMKDVTTLLQTPLHETCSQSKTGERFPTRIRSRFPLQGGDACQGLVTPAICPGNSVPQELA